ncbi:MAG TPA: hypothetical protein VG105_16635 [Paraburkholderia sp.]|jgi:hypothetical protein|nr:hypothetical protein [Paraburkholderia sp.]
MARPKIGIFGALVAMGGVLAWRWAQKHRASQAVLNRELNRWEGEGGAVAAIEQAAPSVPARAPGTAHHPAPNGAVRTDGVGEAWPFPHG